MSPTLDTLPDEVLLDALAPVLPLSSLLALSQVNSHLHAVFSDNTLWRRRVHKDLNVPDSVTAREDGWKELYGRLRRPSVYVWGATANARLGIPRSHPALATFHASYDGVNVPVRLPSLPAHVGIVDLQASGYGFVGLDTNGGVWCWGTLDGSALLSRSRPDWTKGGAMATEPRRIMLPTRVRSVSCGRRHVLVLDEAGSVWELTGWGKAWRREGSSFGTVAQLDAGWAHSAVLSADGEVSVWWPSYNAFSEDERASATLSSSHPNDELADNEIDVLYNTTAEEPIVLPPLPSADVAPGHFGDARRPSAAPKIIKIACGDGFVVALTEEGRVWTGWIGGRSSEVGGTEGRVWEEHPAFRHPREDDTNRITHVSAHFETFFAYSPGTALDIAASVVLQGKKQQLQSHETGSTGAQPHVIEELQGKGVIKVVVGDYHFGALTSTGKLFTWGSYSSGALGLGQTAQISRPTEVKFEANTPDQADDKFVFAATASGWHTGALVLDHSKSASETAHKHEEQDREERVKLAPTPRHPTLPTHPDTSRFAAIDPPPSGRPIPGQAGVVFPGLTHGLPTPFFGTPAVEPVGQPADWRVARNPRPPPSANEPRQYTLPVQPTPGLFRTQPWAEGRTGRTAGAAREPSHERERPREGDAQGGGGSGSSAATE